MTKRDEEVLDPLIPRVGGEETFADHQLYPLISFLVRSNSRIIPRLLDAYSTMGDERLLLPTCMALAACGQRPDYARQLKEFLEKQPENCRIDECGAGELARQILKVIFNQ